MLKRVAPKVSLWFALIAGAVLLAACGGKGESTSAPAGLSVVEGDGRVTVSWSADTGVEYWLFYAEGAGVTTTNWNDGTRNGKAIVAVTSPFVVSGLTNGKLYSFTVNGRRDGGPGGAGATAASATPRLAGNAWAVSGTTANAEFSSVAAAGLGNFALIATGANGAIYTSDDGKVWATRTSGTTNNLNAVSTTGFTAFAVGDNGTIVRSVDPATWTVVTSGTTTKLNGVSAASSGNNVAVGNIGTILSSVDGTTWTPRTSGTAVDLLSVTFVNSRFIALGRDGVVLESTDSATWTARSIAGAGALRGVAFTNTVYVVVGDGGAMYTSPDLVTWTKETSGTNVNINSITAGSQLIAVGDGGTILTSADGKAWKFGTSGTTANLRAATARAGGYIIVGAGGVSLTSY